MSLYLSSVNCPRRILILCCNRCLMIWWVRVRVRVRVGILFEIIVGVVSNDDDGCTTAAAT